jgi:uncharacterized tellurite resistance protein B-like protein
MIRADALALLKVLIAAAWADRRLSQSEMNYLKTLSRRFNLSDADWAELEPYFEDAPSESETDALFKDLLARIATPLGRNQVVRHIEDILSADANMTAEEHDFLEQYTLVLKEASTVELIVGKLKGLFQKRPPGTTLDLDEFVRNKILFKLRRKMCTAEFTPITPEMYRLCLLGGLMGVVARADGDIDFKELQEIRRQIQSYAKFEPEALDMLMSIIEEESVRGLDRARLVSEYTANAGFEDRVALLDLLFAVAAADGALTHAELEELRGISAAMNLSHRQYIDAKLRAKK